MSCPKFIEQLILDLSIFIIARTRAHYFGPKVDNLRLSR